MTTAEINIFLAVQGIRLTDLARELGCTAGQLSATISGLRTNANLRKKFAKYFNKSVEEFFGADFEVVATVRKGKAA